MTAYLDIFIALQGIAVIEDKDAVDAFADMWARQDRWAFSVSIRPAAKPAAAFDASLQLPALQQTSSLGMEV